jgi:hypothetical protein
MNSFAWRVASALAKLLALTLKQLTVRGYTGSHANLPISYTLGSHLAMIVQNYEVPTIDCCVMKS